MPLTDSQQTLLTRFRDVVAKRHDRIAVREHARRYTYAELGKLIAGVRCGLERAEGDAKSPVGLLLDRSAIAYASMWASIALGRAYVPLNTSYPVSRIKNIVSQAGIGAIVCTDETRELASSIGIEDDCLVVASSDAASAAEIPSDYEWWRAQREGEIAYVLFTSGSTGQPKGVPISYTSLLAFIDNMSAAIPYTPDDVCSQVCELSFDFSVQEVFMALMSGCTLCPARRIDLFNPAHYIASHSISVWISVPSLARVILSNGVRIENSLDSIRISIFNGEALTTGIASAWRDATPKAVLWNSYGPTECTVAVTVQPYFGEKELDEGDVVAIGEPFADCRIALLNEDGIAVTDAAADGLIGELLLSTPQCFAGYTDPDLESPFVIDSNGTRYYRTGDRARWRSGRLYHLGRIDHQVKIGGHRIELMEIEHRLRRCLDTESLAVIAHPARLPTELVLFLEGSQQVPSLGTETLGLPTYMLPKRTVLVETLPTNAHGKLDRTALHSLAESKA